MWTPYVLAPVKMEVSQPFSQPLRRLAEDALRRFTRGRRLAVAARTVAKNSDRATASRLTKSRRENLAIQSAREKGVLHGVVH